MLASVNSELQRAPTGLCGSHLASVFTSLEGLQRRAMPLSRPWESRHVWSAHLPFTSHLPLTKPLPLGERFLPPFWVLSSGPQKAWLQQLRVMLHPSPGWMEDEWDINQNTRTQLMGTWEGAQGLCPSAWIPKALSLWCTCNSCVKLWWPKCLQSFNGQWLLLLGRPFRVIPHRGQQTRALGSNSAHHQFLSIKFYWTWPWGQIHPATYFCQ